MTIPTTGADGGRRVPAAGRGRTSGGAVDPGPACADAPAAPDPIRTPRFEQLRAAWSALIRLSLQQQATAEQVVAPGTTSPPSVRVRRKSRS